MEDCRAEVKPQLSTTLSNQPTILASDTNLDKKFLYEEVFRGRI